MIFIIHVREAEVQAMQSFPRIKISRVAIACVATLFPTSVYAQSSPFADLLQSLLMAKKMAAVCQDRSLTNEFVLQMYGHDANRTVRDNESNEEDALASELMEATGVEVVSARWSGNAAGGACHIVMKVTLPSGYIAQLGGGSELKGDMWFNLQPRGTSWTLVSITDNEGSGGNSFRQYLAPYTDALVQQRLNQKKQARLEEERQRELQAAEQRRAWIKAHPQEYAAILRQQAADRVRLRSILLQDAADNARRQSACEAHGGTWGRRTRHDIPFGENGCFFQTAN